MSMIAYFPPLHRQNPIYFSITLKSYTIYVIFTSSLLQTRRKLSANLFDNCASALESAPSRNVPGTFSGREGIQLGEVPAAFQQAEAKYEKFRVQVIVLFSKHITLSKLFMIFFF